MATTETAERATLLEELGSTFTDRFSLDIELGSGGMARVFRAVDRELGRNVAIKIQKRDPNFEEASFQRFLFEAKAGARVTDPNVVAVLDCGGLGDLWWIVSELVEGHSLESELEKSPGAMQTKRALRLAAQIAQGLVALHGAGLVHRDLKPANVLIEATSGLCKIADLGVAWSDDREFLTSTGVILGTPAYLAPEQIEGQSCAQTDLYSLGVLTFHMLTRQYPFPGQCEVASFKSRLRSAAPPVRLADFDPGLAGPLDELVHALFSRDPAHRPSPAAQVAKSFSTLAITYAVRPTRRERVLAAPPAPGPHQPMARAAAHVLPEAGNAAARALRPGPLQLAVTVATAAPVGRDPGAPSPGTETAVPQAGGHPMSTRRRRKISPRSWLAAGLVIGLGCLWVASRQTVVAPPVSPPRVDEETQLADEVTAALTSSAHGMPLGGRPLHDQLRTVPREIGRAPVLTLESRDLAKVLDDRLGNRWTPDAWSRLGRWIRRKDVPLEARLDLHEAVSRWAPLGLTLEDSDGGTPVAAPLPDLESVTSGLVQVSRNTLKGVTPVGSTTRLIPVGLPVTYQMMQLAMQGVPEIAQWNLRGDERQEHRSNPNLVGPMTVLGFTASFWNGGLRALDEEAGRQISPAQWRFARLGGVQTIPLDPTWPSVTPRSGILRLVMDVIEMGPGTAIKLTIKLARPPGRHIEVWLAGPPRSHWHSSPRETVEQRGAHRTLFQVILAHGLEPSSAPGAVALRMGAVVHEGGGSSLPYEGVVAATRFQPVEGGRAPRKLARDYERLSCLIHEPRWEVRTSTGNEGHSR